MRRRVPAFRRHAQLAALASVALLFLHLVAGVFNRYAFFRPMWYTDSALARYVAARQALASAYLNSSAAHASAVLRNDSDVCVAVQHFPRSPRTVHRTLASLLSGTRYPFSLVVLDSAFPSPDLDVARSIPQVRIVPRAEAVRMFAAAHADLSASTAFNETEWKLRQRVDYALALHVASCSASCAYVLLAENDAVFSVNVAERISFLGHSLDTLHPGWAMLRLFHSDFWSGWQRTRADARTLAQFAAAGALLCGAVSALLAQPPASRWSAGLVWSAFGAVWGALFPVLTGKQHMPLPWGTRVSGGLVDAAELGTVSSIAHVYPRAVACALARDLIASCCNGLAEVDLAIGLMSAVRGKPMFQVLPNLAQHVGFASTSPDKAVDFAKEMRKRLAPHHVQSSSFDARGVVFR